MSVATRHYARFCAEFYVSLSLLASFQSDHCVVPCWLVEQRVPGWVLRPVSFTQVFKLTTVWYCETGENSADRSLIQQSNDCNLPHLIAAGISHHQRMYAIIYFEGFAHGQPVFLGCYASACKETMAAVLPGFLHAKLSDHLKCL